MMPGNRTRALVVGAGKIGTAIAALLASAPDYDVTVLDRTEQALRRAESLGVRTVRGDIADAAMLGRLAGRQQRHGAQRCPVPLDHKRRAGRV